MILHLFAFIFCALKHWRGLCWLNSIDFNIFQGYDMAYIIEVWIYLVDMLLIRLLLSHNWAFIWPFSFHIQSDLGHNHILVIRDLIVQSTLGNYSRQVIGFAGQLRFYWITNLQFNRMSSRTETGVIFIWFRIEV